MSRPGYVKVTEKLLQPFVAHAVAQLPLEILEPHFDVRVEDEIGVLVAHLRGYVWAEEIQDDTATLTVEWPATVWQAFKDRWFPMWALRRWPVKTLSRTAEYRFQVKALLPEYKYVAPVASRVVLKAFKTPDVRFRGDKPQDEDE